MKNYRPTFYSVLNMLFQSLIKSLRMNDARSSLFTWRILHFRLFFTHSSNRWVNFRIWKMHGLRFLRVFKHALKEFDFQKNHVSLLCTFFNALGWIFLDLKTVCSMNTLMWVEWNKRLVKSTLIYILVFQNNTRRTIEDDNVKSQVIYVVTGPSRNW